MDILIFGFYGYIENIGEYFDKNIDKTKINKKYFEINENILLNHKKEINKPIYIC